VEDRLDLLEGDFLKTSISTVRLGPLTRQLKMHITYFGMSRLAFIA